MNKIKYLIVFLSFFIIFVNSQSSSLVLIEYYQYREVCSIKDLGYTEPSTLCHNNTLLSKSIVKQSECIVFQMEPAIFTYDPNNNQIVQKIYSDIVCKDYVDSKIHIIGSCNSTCMVGDGLIYKMSLVDQVEIPSSTLVSVIYGDKCNKIFKNSFLEIDYQYLNNCQVDYEVEPIYSVKTYCNETFITSYIYNGSLCSGQTTNIEYYPIVNICSTPDSPLNFMQFCNN
ncbi:hypothetical protein DICPUDRAFT_37788 [Dictyostelium purpureum]|uniref:SUEL-type lectin domain-containing protein n=1 Tax=Dictyostelium purpureum TaxID=5786 RepID=F0ZTG1_DICPU|nr:uncharacterized protein DICPUDRAFT_37788 [Dictyostelium purpureum]EGC32778.1 hypothetical protein DICPUDRAFT_37788 [Dictyostelium purpureum]|eukprot:XP_003290701.1 hypothetical protein DICPUDRAFT_37788 [Dictyostelium purpureum]